MLRISYIHVLLHDMSRPLGKPTICIGENKGADQLISAFVFATRIVQFLFYLNQKFQASSSLLCLYSLVCVEPVRKKVQVGKDQEKAQSERDSHSKKRGGKKLN